MAGAEALVDDCRRDGREERRFLVLRPPRYGRHEFGFHGVHHDVVPPERVVRTVEFEGMPGHVQLETLALEDFEGKTRVRGQAVFQSQEARDGELNSGMEAGLSESFDRLDELLKQLRHR